MWLPLAILAAPAAVIGWVNIGGGFGTLVEGALPRELRHFEAEIDPLVLVTSTLFAFGGIGLGAAIYYRDRPAAERLRAGFGPLHTLVERKYFMDEIAETVVVRGLLHGVIGRALEAFDTHVVDATVNGVGRATRLAGDALRRAETGQLQAYTSLFFAGVVLVAAVMFAISGNVLER